MKKISEAALNTLKNVSIDEKAFRVKLNSGKLDRELYKEVDEIFNRLKGKWNKKLYSHVFEENPKPAIEAILETEEMPPKNPTAFFPTPQLLIENMFKIADFIDLSTCEYIEDFRILEPSSGNGNIAKHIRKVAPNATLDLVEYLPLNQKLLKKEGFNPICGDFLEYNKDYSIKYNYIFMNPPFSLEHDKKAYITHINHALKMLKPSGVLIAIAPCGFLANNTKKEKDFFNLVAKHGRIYSNKKDSFKDSGTNVDTVTIEFNTSNWKTRPFNGYKNYFVFLLMFHLNNDNRYEQKVKRLLYSKEFPEDKQFEDLITDLITDLIKIEELISWNYTDLYIERLKELCVEYRVENDLNIPDELNKYVYDNEITEIKSEEKFTIFIPESKKSKDEVSGSNIAVSKKKLDEIIKENGYIQPVLF